MRTAIIEMYALNKQKKYNSDLHFSRTTTTYIIFVQRNLFAIIHLNKYKQMNKQTKKHTYAYIGLK